MDSKWHEHHDYQEFLVSKDRESLLPSKFYEEFLNLSPSFHNKIEPFRILDYGCGLGYTSIFIARKLLKISSVKIYACDYQEKLLDQLWYRIVQNKLTNITPFYMDRHAMLNFPTWLPQMDHIICSFCFSAANNTPDILKLLKKIMKPNAFLHIVDWDALKKNHVLDVYVKKDYKIKIDTFTDLLQKAGYKIHKNYKIPLSHTYFAMSVKI